MYFVLMSISVYPSIVIKKTRLGRPVDNRPSSPGYTGSVNKKVPTKSIQLEGKAR